MTQPRPTSKQSLWTELRRYWVIFWRLRAMHLGRTLEHRANFWFWAIVSSLWSAFNLFFIGTLASLQHGLAGWKPAEVYLLMSWYTILDTFIWSWVYPNMSQYTRGVFSGEFSGWLLKPVNTAFIVLTKENNFVSTFRLVLGIGMLFWTVPQLDHPPNIVTWLGTLVAFTGSLLLSYSMWFGIATLAFWVDKLDNINDIPPTLRKLWQVPRQVYEQAGAGWLSTIIPLGLVVSVPSEVLIGREVWGWVGYLWLVALISFSLSLVFFQYSLRRYGASGG
jgi:ABC-2 type transport system permease protein